MPAAMILITAFLLPGCSSPPRVGDKYEQLPSRTKIVSLAFVYTGKEIQEHYASDPHFVNIFGNTTFVIGLDDDSQDVGYNAEQARKEAQSKYFEAHRDTRFVGYMEGGLVFILSVDELNKRFVLQE
jgi:hypothetical protein